MGNDGGSASAAASLGVIGVPILVVVCAVAAEVDLAQRVGEVVYVPAWRGLGRRVGAVIVILVLA